MAEETPKSTSAPDAPSDPARAAEVFFDGGCPICRREIAVYQRMAGDDVAWRDVTGADVAAPEADRATLLARFHARRADGRLVSGFAAFLAVWRATPRLAWAARLLDRQPFLWLGESAYRAFLAIRPLWRGRGQTAPATQGRDGGQV